MLCYKTETFDFGSKAETFRTETETFSRPYIQVNCNPCFFQGCYDVLRTYSLELEQTSQKFLALSGIHSSDFQQSNRTTVTDVNSSKTVSGPYWLVRVSYSAKQKQELISLLRSIFLAKLNFKLSARYDATCQPKEDVYCT